MIRWYKVQGLEGVDMPHPRDSDRPLGKTLDGALYAEWLPDCVALREELASASPRVSVIAGPIMAINAVRAEENLPR